ncbi:hypothetical protein SFUMM280S_02569 [Streptomyces fumanus]
MFGGDVVRLHPRVEYAGTGGEAELFGLYFTDEGQHQEHRLLVDHNVPHCKSNVVYKGALQGDDAHAVWIGDVLIEARAEGTDTYEMNRNLVPHGRRPRRLGAEPGDRDRRDRRRRSRLRHRSLRRRAALLPDGPRHPGDGGPPPGGPRLLRKLVQQIGVPDVEERLIAKIEGAGGVGRMAFVRVCGAGELEEDTPKRVELDGTPVSVVRTGGEVFAINDILLARERVPRRGRGRRLRHRVLAARVALRPAHRQAGGLPARAPSPYTP